MSEIMAPDPRAVSAVRWDGLGRAARRGLLVLRPVWLDAANPGMGGVFGNGCRSPLE